MIVVEGIFPAYEVPRLCAPIRPAEGSCGSREPRREAVRSRRRTVAQEDVNAAAEVFRRFAQYVDATARFRNIAVPVIGKLHHGEGTR